MEGSRRTTAQASVVVSARKYDGHEHRSWVAHLVRREGSLLVLDALFDREIEHEVLGTISAGTVSTEYYWLDKWYNIFRFSEPSGALRSYYCNVNAPPSWDERVLSYVDLDIDVLVEPDLSYRILDLDDFEHNAMLYGYPPDVQRNAQQAISELIGLIEGRIFPFDERSLPT